jgi:hypothetical protein
LRLSGHRVASAAAVGSLFGTFVLNITMLGFEAHLEFRLLWCAEGTADLVTFRDYNMQEAQLLIASTSWPRN